MLQIQFPTVVSLLILLLKINETSSDCRKTFVMYCDNLNDYLKYETDTWRQLIIGNNNKPIDKWSIWNVWHFLVQDLDKLESLTINNQLHDKFSDVISVALAHEKIKYLNFYRNDLSNFYPSYFRSFPSLIELNLVDNNIKQIAGYRPAYSLDTVDLSQNKLAEIQENALRSMNIRLLIIRSNQLTNIGAKAFNESLEILNLDYNKFTYFPDDGLENLENLKELTMSHNKITLLAKLSFLTKIEKLDFSYNEIVSVRTNFQRFSNLRHINLSHNFIKQINFVSLIPDNQFPKKISIAFNHLTQFQLDQKDWTDFNFTSPVTVILFGNPWICKCLDEMEVFLKERPFKRSACDLSLFGNGRFPSCVNQKVCIAVGIALETSFYDSFFNILNESKKFFTCNVDLDMLNLQSNIRSFSFVGQPVQFRKVGNKLVAEY